MKKNLLTKLEKLAPPAPPPPTIFTEFEVRLLTVGERKDLIELLRSEDDAGSTSDPYMLPTIREARRRITARKEYASTWMSWPGRIYETSLADPWSLEQELAEMGRSGIKNTT